MSMADVSIAARAKRKRGRPRKDSNLSNAAPSLTSPDNSTFIKTQGSGSGDHLIYSPPPHATKKPQDANDDCMVGSTVYGVVERPFDAGYFISVRIGNNLTPFHGLVFLPWKVVSVTPTNDVAPQANMYQTGAGIGGGGGGTGETFQSDQRGTLQPPPPPKQAVVRPLMMAPYTTSNQSSFMAAAHDEASAVVMRPGGSSCNVTATKQQAQFPYVHGSLRMVEEDDVMQVYEVSTSSAGRSKGNLADQEGQPHSKTVESSPHQQPPSCSNNLEMLHNRSAFDQIQKEEMMCRESIAHTSVAAAPQLRPSNLFQDVNFSENIFSNNHNHNHNQCSAREQESSSSLAAQLVENITKSPSLKLDLAFTVHNEKQVTEAGQGGGGGIYMKSPNIGFHQALVSGNPLLLPPDLMEEPLEFMMEKPKIPTAASNEQQGNMEVQSRLVGGGGDEQDEGLSSNNNSNGNMIGGEGEDAAAKLELATPQNTRIADMDFVLTNTMHQSHSHTNDGSL